MLDKCFHVKTPSTWWKKRINNKKRNYNTVSHSYPVNLHEDIKKGGWGGWKKEGYDNYSQLSKAGSSAFTLSAV